MKRRYLFLLTIALSLILIGGFFVFTKSINPLITLSPSSIKKIEIKKTPTDVLKITDVKKIEDISIKLKNLKLTEIRSKNIGDFEFTILISGTKERNLIITEDYFILDNTYYLIDNPKDIKDMLYSYFQPKK